MEMNRVQSLEVRAERRFQNPSNIFIEEEACVNLTMGSHGCLRSGYPTNITASLIQRTSYGKLRNSLENKHA
jgi:hypothetical protein